MLSDLLKYISPYSINGTRNDFFLGRGEGGIITFKFLKVKNKYFPVIL